MSFSNLFLPENQNQNSPTKINLPDRFTILCVDDDLSILKALIRVFRKQNYQILTAKSGDEALKIFKDSKNSIQMIISDYQMPGMNGAELLRQVKSLTPETIRIMLTGHADSNAVMGAINEGAVYKFILKPWNDDDLRKSVV